MVFKDKLIEYGLLIGVTFAVVTLIIFFARKLLNKLIHKSNNNEDEDATGLIFLKNATGFILYSLAIFWIFYKIPYFKALGSALFAGAGVLVAVVGFASQKAFSNIIGGLFILVFKPFRVGDTIELSGKIAGIVEGITLRHTIIKDYEFRCVIIPNGVINDETIINSSFSDEKIRLHIEFQVAYATDLDLAIKVITEQIKTHEYFIDNRTHLEKISNVPAVVVRVTQLGDSGITLRAYVWVRNSDDAFVLKCDTYKNIKTAFDNNGIEIPFPHRTLIVKETPEILK